jgi:signal transduction histidine kinase
MSSGLLEILSLHWQGRVVDAHARARAVLDSGELRDEHEVDLLEAEQGLIAAKLGVDDGLFDSAGRGRSRLTRLIREYARFSHFFWANERRTPPVLGRLFWLALQCPRSGMLPTTVFLIGHLAAIAGSTRLGYLIALIAFRHVSTARHRPIAATAFSQSIVFAAFPYTVLVSRKLSRLDEVTAVCQRRLSRDPYYETIFLVGAIYAAAYTGDVVKAEIFSAHLTELQATATVHRYTPIVRIARILPLALRGYSHLVAKDFDEMLLQHDPSRSNALINSQFYRMAALVCLAMRRFDDTIRWIRMAMSYRQQSGWFTAWSHVEELILQWAELRVSFDPRRHALFEGPLQFDSPATLGALLVESISAFPVAYTGGIRAFEDRLFALLRRHLDCPLADVTESLGHLSAREPQLRVGSRYFVCKGLSPERLVVVDRLLSTIAPVFQIMLAGVGEMLEAKAASERASRDAAIAKTTQMLAHDFRQPFAMLQMAIEALRGAPGPEQIQRMIDQLLPDIIDASAWAESLITDIMDIGSDAPYELEPAVPEVLLASALAQAFFVHPSPNVKVSYDLEHQHQVLVDQRKIRRVFANVLANAIQAINADGRIWFATQDVEERGLPCVEFTIGNSGPLVAEAHVSQLFEAFFTQGKSNGTGLGLAIARRVVEAHRGRIRYVGLPGIGVEFRFTLPRGPARDGRALVELPTNGVWRGAAPSNLPPRLPSGPTEAAGEATPNELPEVGLIDDSRVYLAGWRSVLGGHAKLRYFASPELFWAATRADPGLLERLAVVITDYRFANSAESGVSFAAALRSRRPQLPILLSSSGIFSEVEVRESFDGVLDKAAISWAHLQALIPLAKSAGAPSTPNSRVT